MSLLRLLTAGRSLVGLKKAEKRYHLPAARALPMFGAKQNPFRATALPEKPESAGESSNEVRAAGGDLTHGQGSGAAGTGPVNDKAIPVQPKGKGDEAQNSNLGTSSKSGGAAEKSRGSAIRALLVWGRAKKGKPRGSARPLVQAELSLESVKVVRNDLSESDLEVVRACQRPGATDSSGASTGAAKLPDLVPGWGAASRLLGMSKM